MKRRLYLLGIGIIVAALLPAVAWATTLPFINEIHYDNVGSDLNEGIEIAGPAGFDLSGWSLVLYNGSGGLVYKDLLLSGTVTNQQNNYGVLWFPISGMQNGAPDGIAFIDPSNVPMQFLSYEGDFTASNGAAAGMLSEDIGIRQDSPVPVAGYSLQLIGAGSAYSDFAWGGPVLSTPGAVNTGQTFPSTATAAIPEPASLSILGMGLLCLLCKNVVKKNRALSLA
ncbi:hypothetical protein ACFL2J_05890 [Candidatus Omnitrophota bacterium]